MATHQEIPPASHAMQIARSPAQITISPSQCKCCTYCDYEGHLVDQCYYIIGFRVGHKWHRKNVKPRNKKVAAHNVEMKREPTNESLIFTAEEYKQIMALLYSKNGNNQPLTNATCIFTPSYANIEHDAHSTLYWIVDSGATDHVSHLSPTHNKTKAAHDFVGLPNGKQATIENVGS